MRKSRKLLAKKPSSPMKNSILSQKNTTAVFSNGKIGTTCFPRILCWSLRWLVLFHAKSGNCQIWCNQKNCLSAIRPKIFLVFLRTTNEHCTSWETAFSEWHFKEDFISAVGRCGLVKEFEFQWLVYWQRFC